MPRTGPRDLANQALRYGTNLPQLISRPLADKQTRHGLSLPA
jgi:hypothetical protein